jgi:DNA-binding HxlR family transcriptional regulator
MQVKISRLNKIFESRVRLGIMSILMVNDTFAFNSFKETLDVTDGNLASHLKALEENGLVSASKQFLGRKPNTTYSATENGKELFREHLSALEDLIKSK